MTAKLKAAKPASPKQIAFLKDLGFKDVDAWSFEQASYTLSHAQEIRYYAFQIAREVWDKDLQGYDPRPLVHTIFPNERMRTDIYAEMEKRDQIAMQRQEQWRAEHEYDTDPHLESPFIGDLKPPLARGENFSLVKAHLAKLLGLDTKSTWQKLTQWFSPPKNNEENPTTSTAGAMIWKAKE